MSIFGRIARGVMSRITKHVSVNQTETRYATVVVEAMCWADALRRLGVPDECIKIELEVAGERTWTKVEDFANLKISEGLSDEYVAVVTAWKPLQEGSWQKRLPIGDLADVFDKQLLSLAQEWDPYTNPRWVAAWNDSAARQMGVGLVMELLDKGFTIPNAVGF